MHCALNDVCVEQTPLFYGGTVHSGITETTAGVVTYEESFADNAEIVTGIRFCETTDNKLFRSWALQYTETSTGIAQRQEYGEYVPDDDTLDFVCTNFDVITVEITDLVAYIDSRDVEGLTFKFEDGTQREYRANYPTPSPDYRLEGRLVGFKAFFGDNGSGVTLTDQPLAFHMLYNSCMCPLSEFIV